MRRRGDGDGKTETDWSEAAMGPGLQAAPGAGGAGAPQEPCKGAQPCPGLDSSPV